MFKSMLTIICPSIIIPAIMLPRFSYFTPNPSPRCQSQTKPHRTIPQSMINHGIISPISGRAEHKPCQNHTAIMLKPCRNHDNPTKIMPKSYQTANQSASQPWPTSQWPTTWQAGRQASRQASNQPANQPASQPADQLGSKR